MLNNKSSDFFYPNDIDQESVSIGESFTNNETSELQSIESLLVKKYSNIILVNSFGEGCYLFRNNDRALVVRACSSFFPFEQELLRRKNAVLNSMRMIPNIAQMINHELLENDGDYYIVKEVNWINGLESIDRFEVKNLLQSSSYLGELVTTYGFLLKSLFTQGMLYDFILESKGDSRLHKFLLSDNMFSYPDTSGQIRLFLDLDWYITLSDNKITGFPISSYIKRFAIGGIKFTAGLITFSTLKFILDIKNKLK